MKNILYRAVILSGVAIVMGLPSPQARAEKPTKVFRVFTLEIQGVRMWLPSTLVVNRGDRVQIIATSKVPAPNEVHGLTIDAFKIQEVVSDGAKTIEFVADKVGIFPLSCHLHPAHIGAQLVVLKP